MKYIMFFALFPVAWITSGSKHSASFEEKNIEVARSADRYTLIGGDTTILLAADEEYVNVMGNRKPTLPSFTTLTKKPGKVRGYVKNLNGQPLAGAFIGLRSSAVGGFYSSASGSTDAKGYYEIELPRGACHFWATGYTLEYGGGVATVSLHPADGDIASFASTEGEVENFVLLSYGIVNQARLQNEPRDAFTYYGGSIRVEFSMYEDMWSRAGSLPANGTIEIMLTPDGETLYGETRRFIIHKKVGGTNFWINNIPVGRYIITAKLKNGGDLKLKATDFWGHQVYGMKPVEASGKATVLFMPFSKDGKSSLPLRGSWKSVNIKVEKQS